MPRTKVTAEQLGVARVLETFGWSHMRIARVFAVDQSTISYALRHRKTHLPTKPQDISSEILARVMDRIERATRRAVARELKAIAQELESAP